MPTQKPDLDAEAHGKSMQQDFHAADGKLRARATGESSQKGFHTGGTSPEAKRSWWRRPELMVPAVVALIIGIATVWAMIRGAEIQSGASPKPAAQERANAPAPPLEATTKE